ncbi:hypothetical protein GCM10009621_13850 [Corynebacterium felinum]
MSTVVGVSLIQEDIRGIVTQFKLNKTCEQAVYNGGTAGGVVEVI